MVGQPNAVKIAQSMSSLLGLKNRKLPRPNYDLYSTVGSPAPLMASQLDLFTAARESLSQACLYFGPRTSVLICFSFSNLLLPSEKFSAHIVQRGMATAICCLRCSKQKTAEEHSQAERAALLRTLIDVQRHTPYPPSPPISHYPTPSTSHSPPSAASFDGAPAPVPSPA